MQEKKNKLKYSHSKRSDTDMLPTSYSQKVHTFVYKDS